MSGIYDMTPWSLRTAVTPDTGKIMKNVPEFFEFWKRIKFATKWYYKVKFSIFFEKKPKKKALTLKGLMKRLLEIPLYKKDKKIRKVKKKNKKKITVRYFTR